MTEAEVEAIVLETVRRYTLNDAAAAGSRFGPDLGLSDAGRQMLFASLAQAFAARGASLPSQRFYLADFLACPTPAAVVAAIRTRVFKTPAARAAPAGESQAGESLALKAPPKKTPKAKSVKAKAKPAKPKAAKKPGGTPKKAAARKGGRSAEKPRR